MLPEVINPTEGLTQAIIGTGMRLYQTYDPEQSWFPFMSGSVINVWQDQSKPVDRSRVNQFNNPKYARMCKDGRFPFVYEKQIHQYVLPFPNTKALSKADFKRLERADFPTWDTNAEGEPIWIPVSKEMNKDIREWCEAHLAGRYHLRPNMLFLEKEEDRFMTMVFWKVQGKAPYKKI